MEVKSSSSSDKSAFEMSVQEVELARAEGHRCGGLAGPRVAPQRLTLGQTDLAVYRTVWKDTAARQWKRVQQPTARTCL